MVVIGKGTLTLEQAISGEVERWSAIVSAENPYREWDKHPWIMCRYMSSLKSSCPFCCFSPQDPQNLFLCAPEIEHFLRTLVLYSKEKGFITICKAAVQALKFVIKKSDLLGVVPSDNAKRILSEHAVMGEGHEAL